MNKVDRISSLRVAVAAARKEKKTIAFVPTMGNLHEGHLELVRKAKVYADYVVVSIYVNPTQFGANEDLANYPSTPEQDALMLAEQGADLLFLPTDEIMYPGDLSKQTYVEVPDLGAEYCGLHRPEHFRGVTTVVARLFNMVQPDIAVFGKKDYQQLFMIKKMVADLAYPIDVRGVDTVRADDGLALSSRNGYLNKKQRKIAPALYREVQLIAEQLQNKVKKFPKLENNAKINLEKQGFEPHYISICRQSDLMPAKQDDTELVILAAAKLGPSRLIDNLEVNIET